MPHEAQERYSSLVLAKMRSENILKDGIIFNNDYEGDPVAGAVKVPVRDGEVKVGDYDRSAGGDLSESSTEYRSILINRRSCREVRQRAYRQLRRGFRARQPCR